MYYLKINDDLYRADFTGKIKDTEWDNRSSKTITTDLSFTQVENLFHDDMKWAIHESKTTTVQSVDADGFPIFEDQIMLDDEGNIVRDENDEPMYAKIPVTQEVDISEDYDNSDYSVLGDIIVHNDGTISIKMGKPTELEEAYMILYGGADDE